MVKSTLEAFERWLALSKRESSPEISLAEREEEEMAEKTVRRLDMLAREYAHHAGAMDRFLGLILSNGLDEANQALKSDVQVHFEDRLLPLIRLHQNETEAELVNGLAAAEFVLPRANRLNFTIAVIAAVLVIVLGLLIARSIAKPLSASHRQCSYQRFRIQAHDVDQSWRTGAADPHRYRDSGVLVGVGVAKRGQRMPRSFRDLEINDFPL